MILFKGKENRYCILLFAPIFSLNFKIHIHVLCIFFIVLYMYQINNLTYVTGEHCEMYVKHFEGLFGTDALAEMVAAS